MTPREAIAKGLLWALIRLRGLHALLGGLGHSPHVCMIEPWDPPDVGPWEGVCSPRICPHHQECGDMARLLRYYEG